MLNISFAAAARNSGVLERVYTGLGGAGDHHQLM